MKCYDATFEFIKSSPGIKFSDKTLLRYKLCNHALARIKYGLLSTGIVVECT